jgi:hypothetical protein
MRWYLFALFLINCGMAAVFIWRHQFVMGAYACAIALVCLNYSVDCIRLNDRFLDPIDISNEPMSGRFVYAYDIYPDQVEKINLNLGAVEIILSPEQHQKLREFYSLPAPSPREHVNEPQAVS